MIHINICEWYSVSIGIKEELEEQAGAELGQAQLTLGLGFNLL